MIAAFNKGSAPLDHPSFVRHFASFRGLREQAPNLMAMGDVPDGYHSTTGLIYEMQVIFHDAGLTREA